MNILLTKLAAHLFIVLTGYFVLKNFTNNKYIFFLSYVCGFLFLSFASFIFVIQKFFFIQNIYIFTFLVLIILLFETKISFLKLLNLNKVYFFLIITLFTLFGFFVATTDSGAYVYMGQQYLKENLLIVENLYFAPMYSLFLLFIKNFFNLSYLTEVNFFTLVSTLVFIIFNESKNLNNKKTFFILSGITTAYFFSNYFVIINSFLISPGVIFASLILLNSYILLFENLNKKYFKIIFYITTVSLIFLRLEGFIFSYFFLLIYIFKNFKKNNNLYSFNKNNFLIYYTSISILFFLWKLVEFLYFKEGFFNEGIILIVISSNFLILFLPYILIKLTKTSNIRFNTYTLTNLILIFLFILNLFLLFFFPEKIINYQIIFKNLFYTSFWGSWWITTILFIIISFYFISENLKSYIINIEILKFFLIFINCVFFLGSIRQNNFRLDLTDPLFYIWGDSGNRIILYISFILFLFFISLIKKIILK